MDYGEVVHHITPIKEKWDARLDQDNLVLLTNANHNTIHKMLEEDQNGCKDMLHSLKKRFELEFCGKDKGEGG